MRRFYLVNLLVVLFAITATSSVSAQLINFLGPRLYVHQPAGVMGYKTFTYSSDPGISGPWGRKLDSTWKNVPLVKSADSLGCAQPGSANYTGKWVLIWRGTCQFGEKAKNAQDKGAAGVIIINNVAGADPVGMAAGTAGGAVTIPVLMVSNPEGAAIWSALGSNPVTISLCVWGLGNANDLAIVPKSEALTVGATPFNQMNGSTATAYKQYTGALIANVGTNPQANVKIKSVTTFTPTGGSATVVYQDSAVAANFNTIDSIISITSPNVGTLNPTSTGVFTTTYTVSADAPDDNTADNSVSYSTYVTKNVFCKSRTDADGNPIITGSRRFNSTGGFIWGPLFYVTKGGYKAQSIKYAINDNDTSKHSLDQITVADKNSISYLFKWVDGSNSSPADKIIQAAEVELKGASIHQFTSADSNNRLFTSYIGDKDGNPATVALDANSWYWVIVDMPGPTFLCSDDKYSYFTRALAAKNVTPSVLDWSTPMFLGSMSTFTDNGSQNANMLIGATSVAASASIDSVSFPNSDGIPAIALEQSLFPITVNEIANSSMKEFSVYPNPATTSINVKLNLSQKSENVQVRVIDAVGRRILTEDYNNLQKETVTISTEKLAAGNYYVVLIANGKVAVQPFVVSKQ